CLARARGTSPPGRHQPRPPPGLPALLRLAPAGVVMNKVVVHSKLRVFDRFFRIDEAELSYERFDGTMSEHVRRLCFERGDAVAAIVFDNDSRRATFVKQFRYPTYDKGPGWIVEAVAGMVERNETP